MTKKTLNYFAEPCPYGVIDEVVIPPNDKGQIKSFFLHRQSEVVKARPCQWSRTLFNTGSVFFFSEDEYKVDFLVYTRNLVPAVNRIFRLKNELNFYPSTKLRV